MYTIGIKKALQWHTALIQLLWHTSAIGDPAVNTYLHSLENQSKDRSLHTPA